MKEKISYIVLFSLFFFKSYAQEFTVEGFLTTPSGNPVSHAETLILDNGNLIASKITSIEGYFSFLLPFGEYTLQVHFFGEKVYEQNLAINKNINLGKIIAHTEIILEEVEITGKKRLIEMKVDRTIFHVENSIKSVGSDAFDLLRGIPGVQVQNQAIAITGKTGVGVLVDDRLIPLRGEDLINYIKNIPSENIQSIEVITTPPAKYDAEGAGGLINIRLKKTKENTWAASLRNMYIQSTYPSFASGINFTYSKNKLNFTADIGKTTGNYATYVQIDTQYPEKEWINRNTRKNSQDNYTGFLNTSYKLSDKTSVGAQWTGSWQTPDMVDRNTLRVIDRETQTMDFKNLASGHNKAYTDLHTFNIHLTQKLDTIGKRTTLDFDYFTYENTQDRIFSAMNYTPSDDPVPDSHFSGRNTALQNMTNYSVLLDFDLPFKNFSINTGGKLSYIRNFNDIGFAETTSGIAVIDPSQIDRFNYHEDTQAAYLTVSKNFSEKWKTQAGMRYENTQTKGISYSLNQIDKNQYSQWFPSLYLMYTHNENHSLNINYNKRIGRPRYWDLNPFRWYMNPFSIVEGNPFLRPVFHEKAELTYNYKNTLISQVFFRNELNGATQIMIANPDTGIVNTIHDNFYNQYKLGISQTYIMNKWNRWESTNQVTAYYCKSEFTKDIPARILNGYAVRFETNNSFLLNKEGTFLASINYYYNFPYRALFSEINSISSLDFGFRYVVKEKGITMFAYVNDIFRGDLYRVTSYVNNTPIINSHYSDIRSLRLGIYYKFGNKSISGGKRKSGNLDEQDRINK